MLKAVEDISTTKKRLKIEIPSEAIEEKIKLSLEKMRQQAKIPGFRPGKAPMNMIEKHFGKSAEAETIEKIIPEFYEKALKEADIVPVASPELDGGLNFQRHNPLSLAFTVEIRPRIQNLSYSELAVKDIPITVTDSDIEAALKRLQDGKATYEIAEKAAENGDLVTVDYEIKYDDQTSSAKDQVLQVGIGTLPKEISDSLIGKKAGETAEAEADFPENFHVKALAGKKTMVKNHIKAVKKKILPAIDDELAKDLGFENLDSLKAGVREEIEKAKKNEVQKIQKDEILEKLVNTHDFDLPESMLDRELSALVSEVRAAKKSDKDENALRNELRPEAVRTAKAEILLSVIGGKEGIIVTDDEMKEKILEISQRLSMTPETLMKIYIQRDGSLEGFRSSLHGQKVLDLLLSMAKTEKGEQS
ncbi:MAG: trigger factor [Nitrospirae bacterium]|nr:trigger factor [Nitrospirota bacterium]